MDLDEPKSQTSRTTHQVVTPCVCRADPIGSADVADNEPVPSLDGRMVQRLYASAKAERWGLSLPAFEEALAGSIGRTFSSGAPGPREIERYLRGLHLEDLALAAACIAGHDAAWEHLVLEYRPALYRAADAIDPTGRARELADALYADLFASTRGEGESRSLLRYFHGRSSLATWLRSVLAQRHVDAVRSTRRLESLPDSEALPAPAVASSEPDRDRFLALLQQALDTAIKQLEPRDRLRLACYYAQQLTLAEIGRLLHEHEATVSRHLSKTRQSLRRAVEGWLEHEAGLRPDEVRRCLQIAMEDPGPLDLDSALAPATDRKVSDPHRSKRETP